MNLQNIIKSCTEGNRAAQNKLYHLMYRDLFHVPMRYLGSKNEANTVFNQAMLKVFLHIEKLENITNIKGWIHTILQRTTIDHLRKTTNYNKNHISLEDYRLVVEPPSTNDVLNSLEVEDLFIVIQSLPPSNRTVFSLYEIDGYKHKEIAEILSITESNSKYLLHMAKKELRTLLTFKLADYNTNR